MRPALAQVLLSGRQRSRRGPFMQYVPGRARGPRRGPKRATLAGQASPAASPWRRRLRTSQRAQATDVSATRGAISSQGVLPPSLLAVASVALLTSKLWASIVAI